jgi:hypothetical protein
MISDNNHITYSAEDIQRYWNGQLSPQEMHAMEKAALDDPFLADAMEGIGDALQEHDEKIVTAELNNLRQQVQTRTNTAPVRSIRWWKMAAAALVILTVGYWVVSMNGSASKENLALQESSDETRAMSPVATHDSSNKIPAGEKTADNPSPAPASTPDTVSGRTSRFTVDRAKTPEPGYYKFNTNPKKDSSNSFSLSTNERRSLPLPPIDLKNENKDQPAVVKTITAAQTNFDSVSKVETEVVKLPQCALADADKATPKKPESEPKLYNVVSGIVTDNKNNPLANVFLRLDNTKSYTTDVLGNFKIPITDSVIRVWVSLPGYATQNFLLRNTHDGAGIADNQIRLQPSSDPAARLGVEYHSRKAKGKANDSEDFLKGVAFQNAQPANGWLTYEQYLEKNKRIPESNPNLTGEVTVSFIVNKKGELSDFKVDKSLSAQHDAEALRLVKEGPAWKLVKGRKSRVTVIVRF